jgi:replicative DNA helicase
MQNFNDLLRETVKRIEKTSNSSLGIAGVPSGFNDLDKILGGFDNSDLIVIGSRPSMGKTAMLISMALNIAKYQIPVMICSLEMARAQIVDKLISNVAEIESYRLKNGQLNNSECERVISIIDTIKDYPIFIDDAPNPNIELFCGNMKDFVKTHGVKAVLIDYLQLFSTQTKYKNRYEEISLCTRELKRLAKELNLPIIVASQVNRNVEHRQVESVRDKAPQMYDLRDSGTICDDANVVLLLHRPEYYLHNYEDDIRGLAELNIAKNHMGRTATIRLRFNPKFCKFENLQNDLETTANNDVFSNIDINE